jgi:hypothetical protein
LSKKGKWCTLSRSTQSCSTKSFCNPLWLKNTLCLGGLISSPLSFVTTTHSSSKWKKKFWNFRPISLSLSHWLHIGCLWKSLEEENAWCSGALQAASANGSVRIHSTKRWWFRRCQLDYEIMRHFFGELQRHHRQEWGGNFPKTRSSIKATFSSSSLSRNSPIVFLFPPRAIQCARD